MPDPLLCRIAYATNARDDKVARNGSQTALA